MGKKNNKTGTSFRIWHTLMILTMIIIFIFSSQDGDLSSRVSNGTLEWILMKFSGILPEAFLDWLAVWIRKVAHYLIYLVLGFNASNMMISRNRRKTVPGREGTTSFTASELFRKLLSGWLISAVYACTDEIHQLFVPERAGMLRDVLLDSFGACCGVLIAFGIFMLLQSEHLGTVVACSNFRKPK